MYTASTNSTAPAKQVPLTPEDEAMIQAWKRKTPIALLIVIGMIAVFVWIWASSGFMWWLPLVILFTAVAGVAATYKGLTLHVTSKEIIETQLVKIGEKDGDLKYLIFSDRLMLTTMQKMEVDAFEEGAFYRIEKTTGEGFLLRCERISRIEDSK